MTQGKLSRRVAAVAAGAAAVVGLAACGSGGGSAASSSSAANTTAGAVSIKDFKFSPQTVTVKAGVAVQITNNDSQPHTFTSDTTGVFDAGSIPPGGSPAAPVVVKTPGTYAFHCSFHPFMHGTLIVQ